MHLPLRVSIPDPPDVPITAHKEKVVEEKNYLSGNSQLLY